MGCARPLYGAPYLLSLARADMPESSRDGVVGEPGLIDLAGTIQGQQRVAYHVRQCVEIGVGKTSFALQGDAGALVGRAEKCKIARCNPLGIGKNK